MKHILKPETLAAIERDWEAYLSQQLLSAVASQFNAEMDEAQVDQLIESLLTEAVTAGDVSYFICLMLKSAIRKGMILPHLRLPDGSSREPDLRLDRDALSFTSSENGAQTGLVLGLAGKQAE